MKKLSSFYFPPLLSVLLAAPISALSQVLPLLKTNWDQNCFYNSYVPSSGGPCGRSYAGCNATAWGQILKHYTYPTTGNSYHCNASNSSHCVNFALQSYDYAQMPNTLTSENPEVAKLLYHLGVAQDMAWSSSNSSSPFGPIPIKRYFLFSPKMYGVTLSNFSHSEIVSILKIELNAGRPVLANGGNHFYVIDGYDENDRFHCNFGWSGFHNGYYSINSIINNAGNFTPIKLILNIAPLSGSLEISKDTINVPAGNSTNSLDFTSLHDFTISCSDSWISIPKASGAKGYYDGFDGYYLSCLANNGPVRTGYVYISNNSDTDTLVVKQAACPLQLSTYQIKLPSSANSAIINLTNNSVFWSATCTQNWLSVSPASGIGSGSFSVNLEQNNSPTPRFALINVNSNVYLRTVSIEQEAALSTSNPLTPSTVDFLYIQADESLHFNLPSPGKIEILSLSGTCLLQSETLTNRIPVTHLPSGIYLVRQNNYVLGKFVK